MNTRKALFVAAAALLSVAATDAALARGGHGRGGGGHWHGGARIGVFVGAPAFAYGYGYGWRPYSYPYPYYYPPAYVVPAPVVVQPATPPVYIERGDESAAAPAPSTDWYYCPDTKSYYPYVGTCASPWQRVAPQPQS